MAGARLEKNTHPPDSGYRSSPRRRGQRKRMLSYALAALLAALQGAFLPA